MSAPDAGRATVIVAQPLSHAAFAPYGHLIAPGQQQRDINFGTTRRFDDVAHLDTEAEGGRVGVAIFRTDAHTHRAPYPVRAFERHLLGSQSFVPMGASRMLVVLAGSGAQPDASAIVAFVVEAGQGVTLKRGVWHHPLITVGAADVLVIERMAGTEDCEVVPMHAGIDVVLAEG
ncbi:ureidoglycolate lyase [Herbaspirillum sp. alder98]|uniref:ureidoglycolate lyase n=1 Tax=Herbaspirillum sp. alder98 TaxID=2913096 RepID=UPI001CD8E093|nr:ureidoglycolate lyase [Herbaspirillum sp. alder98]MCA1326442.1 ureidoglycolate lyase [Herbaspirillum sp. alder98]